MTAIFFALISYLGWGIGDIFGTIASRKIGGYGIRTSHSMVHHQTRIHPILVSREILKYFSNKVTSPP